MSAKLGALQGHGVRMLAHRHRHLTVNVCVCCVLVLAVRLGHDVVMLPIGWRLARCGMGLPGRYRWLLGVLSPGVEAGSWRPFNECPGLLGRKEYRVLGINLRAGLLGLLAMLLLGSYATSPAFAKGGPFCHHRNSSAEGNGELIKAQTPEVVGGKGGLQILSAKVLGMEVKNEAQSVDISGIIYNNADQCQAKGELVYNERSVSAPFAGCTFKINRNNLVKIYGHAAWKYNNKEAELTEEPKVNQKPDGIGTPVELQEGAKELPSATFAIFIYQTKPGEKCALNGAEVTVSGSAAAQGEPSTLATWSKRVTAYVLGGEGTQVFWNGTAFIPVTTGLKFGEGVHYRGTAEVETKGRQGGAAQEVALFES